MLVQTTNFTCVRRHIVFNSAIVAARITMPGIKLKKLIVLNIKHRFIKKIDFLEKSASNSITCPLAQGLWETQVFNG